MGNNNFGFYDYYDGDNGNEFYDYAEQLIEEGTIGKNVDWSTELGKLNEQVGENRAPIQCWTCKRTYWDANSTGIKYSVVLINNESLFELGFFECL